MINSLIQQAARMAFRKAASVPANIAFAFTNLPPVLARLEKRHGASLTERHNLSPIEAVAVHQLEQNGVFITDLDSLGISPAEANELITCGNQLASVLAQRGAVTGRVRSAVTTSNPLDLMNYPVIYRWGLNPVVLGIVGAYLKGPVAYDGPLVFHAPADGRETGSRRWHQDREDRRVIKVGLYLHDVSQSGGPFQLLNHEVRIGGEAFRYKVFDTRGLRKTLGAAVLSLDTITCSGKTGTLIFAETGRFYHRGKPATVRDRSTVFFSYFARSPRHPFFCARSGLARSQLTRLIHGLSPEQQAAALWRDTLPLFTRLIPPSLT